MVEATTTVTIAVATVRTVITSAMAKVTTVDMGETTTATMVTTIMDEMATATSITNRRSSSPVMRRGPMEAQLVVQQAAVGDFICARLASTSPTLICQPKASTAGELKRM
jgi:hypothetical protein